MPEPESPRQRILDVALELFAEYGYEGASLQQVADRVGLHKSSLFHHFRSKEELARAVYHGLSERLLKRLEPLLVEDPPRLETLLVALEASADHFAEEPASARLLMRLMVNGREAVAADEGDPFAVPRGQESPLDRVLWLVGEWLVRARAAGVIRPVPVRHTVLNLMGLVLFYPAVLLHVPAHLLDVDPRAAEIRAARKRELRVFLSGALAP